MIRKLIKIKKIFARAKSLVKACVPGFLIFGVVPSTFSQVQFPNSFASSASENPFVRDSQPGIPVSIVTGFDPVIVRRIIHSTSFYGRSSEFPFWSVATPYNIHLVRPAFEDEGDPILEPKKILTGANFGCDSETIKSLQKKYTQLRFEDFSDGYRTDSFIIDLICIQGWQELSKTTDMYGKIIELHEAHVTIRENLNRDPLILNPRALGLYGQNSILMMSSPRENKKKDILRMVNRAFTLVFTYLFGDGQLEIQSYGEDAVGFKDK